MADYAKLKDLGEQYEALKQQHQDLLDHHYETQGTREQLAALQQQMGNLVLEIIDVTQGETPQPTKDA
jgi:hypothetical protein